MTPEQVKAMIAAQLAEERLKHDAVTRGLEKQIVGLKDDVKNLEENVEEHQRQIVDLQGDVRGLEICVNDIDVTLAPLMGPVPAPTDFVAGLHGVRTAMAGHGRTNN